MGRVNKVVGWGRGGGGKERERGEDKGRSVYDDGGLRTMGEGEGFLGLSRAGRRRGRGLGR